MSPNNEPSANSPAMWAFLVGIDEYAAKVNPLRGCINDITAMRVFLMNQLLVPESHIRVLLNDQANRANILGTFEKFLINNPDIASGDQILFHFSGHGSRMRDPRGVEPDGYFETIVPYDSRTEGVFDIPDKTLGALLDRLALRKGSNITVLLDCCHSGSGTRRLDGPEMACVRKIDPDDRLPPPALDEAIRDGTASRHAGPSGWPTQNLPYVLLAGCRARELSNEYLVRDSSEASVWHGALTYFLLGHLRQTARSLTYSELLERAATQVNAVYPSQMPQCEGQRDRIVFSGKQVQIDPFLIVTAVKGNSVTLEAGLVHGIRRGTQLAVYGAEVRSRDNLPATPLATVEVRMASATSSEAIVREGSGPVPLRARAIITHQIYAGLRATVALRATTAAEQDSLETVRSAIAKIPRDGKPSPYLEVLTGSGGQPDLTVEATAGQLSIYGANGELLVLPIAAGATGAAEVAQALESIVRYRTVLGLRNEDARSRLTGQIRVGLRQYVEGVDGSRADSLSEAARSEEGLTLYYYPPKEDARNLYVVEVTNESNETVWPHVLVMNPDYSINSLYPRFGEAKELSGRLSLRSGLPGSGGDRLQIYLPDEPRWDSCRDYIKVIVTSRPTQLWLEQPPLQVPPPSQKRGGESPLQELLDTLTSPTRFGTAASSRGVEDWAAVELPFTVVRAYEAKKLGPDPAVVDLGDGLTLRKPAGFEGTVRLATCDQGSRGPEGDPGMRLPPGLEQFAQFQPVTRQGTRGVGEPALVLAFEVDEQSRAAITTANPLHINLPRQAGETAIESFAVAFDGEDYLLAGYCGDDPGTVEVVDLPPLQSDRPERDLMRTIRLYFYKKVGRLPEDLTGLKRSELKDKQVSYSKPERGLLQRGQRVALFVHGFTSDTRWMVLGPAPLFEAFTHYDHWLTWDYETFGTGIQRNGLELAKALREYGFGPDDEVTLDIYAHSMGSLVARCVIELFGGHQYVDRLVMAGPPNRGSPLSNYSRAAVFLLTWLINFSTGIPPLGWGIKRLYNQGLGLADLAVDSENLKLINDLKEPANVPYLVLAGVNNTDEPSRRRLARLARKVLNCTLDVLFQEENDIAVGLSSLRGVRGEAYPRLKVVVLPCNHFQYYAIPEGVDAIRRWLEENP